jgi:pimeloyl-ACP methyl ester carboxylesterase
MPKIAMRDIEVNYEEAGSGYPLILVHGLNGDLTGWVLIMPEFSKHYRTVALDVRGHGGTSKLDQPYSIKGFSEDLYEFMRKLKIPKAHIFGLSMGGAIAQQFALDHGEKIRSLVLVSTFSYVDDHARRAFLRLKNSLAQEGYPAFFDEVVKLAFTPQYIATNPGPIAELKQKRIQINSPVTIGRATDACLAFDLKDQIAKITIPTLVVSGREDVFTPVHLAEQIHRSIRSSEWKILEGVGHNLHVEAAPQLAQTVMSFLQMH